MKDKLMMSITQLSVNVLEAFISDYSIILKFLLDVLDFDITIIMFINLLIFELFTSLKFLDQHVYAVFEKYFTCFISINSDDDIYYHIMMWLDDHKIFINSHSLMIKTEQKHVWNFHDLNTTANELNSNTLINYSNWNFKISSKYFSSTLIVIFSFIKINIFDFIALLNRRWEIVIFVKQRAFDLSVSNARLSLSKISWRTVVIIITIRKSLLLLYTDW